MAKNLVSGSILAHLVQIRAANFFSKILLGQSVDIMVSYHHVQYQKKTNDPILRKLSDGRTDGRTEGRTVRQMRVISQDAVRLTWSVQHRKDFLKKILKSRTHLAIDYSIINVSQKASCVPLTPGIIPVFERFLTCKP